MNSAGAKMPKFALGLAACMCTLRGVAGTSPSSAAQHGVRWANSSVGVHTILIGDSADSPAEVDALAAGGAAPDFIWGGYAEHIPHWQKLNPSIVITKYVSFVRTRTGG